MSGLVPSFVSFQGHTIKVSEVSYVSPVRERQDLDGIALAGFTLVVGPAEIYLSLLGMCGVEEIKRFHGSLVGWLMRGVKEEE